MQSLVEILPATLQMVINISSVQSPRGNKTSQMTTRRRQRRGFFSGREAHSRWKEGDREQGRSATFAATGFPLSAAFTGSVSWGRSVNNRWTFMEMLLLIGQMWPYKGLNGRLDFVTGFLSLVPHLIVS